MSVQWADRQAFSILKFSFLCLNQTLVLTLLEGTSDLFTHQCRTKEKTMHTLKSIIGDNPAQSLIKGQNPESSL